MNKKVLIVHVPYQNSGGEEIHIQQLQEAYKKIGYDVVVFPERKEKYSLLTMLLSLIPFGINADFFEVYKKEKPNFIHINNIFPKLGPRFLNFLARNHIPTVMTLHNHRFFCTNGLALRNGARCTDCMNKRFQWRSLFYNCNGNILKTIYHVLALTIIRFGNLYDSAVKIFIAPSPYIKNELMKSGMSEAKIKHILHPSPSIQLLLAEGPGYDVIYAGRLSREKGICVLLEVVKKLKNIKFLIVGSGGPEEEAVLLAARENKNLTYLPSKTHSEVLELINHSKIGILPSICNEILSLFALEVFNQGKFCVVSDSESMRWLASSGMPAKLAKMGDVESFAEVILAAVSTVPCTERERTAIVQKLSVDRFANELDLLVTAALKATTANN